MDRKENAKIEMLYNSPVLLQSKGRFLMCEIYNLMCNIKNLLTNIKDRVILMPTNHSGGMSNERS